MAKESHFVGLVGSEGPLRGEKKLVLEQENLNSVLKSVHTERPLGSILNLKIRILKTRQPKAKILEFLNFCISKWENGSDGEWTGLLLRYITLPKTIPLKLKIFWPQIPTVRFFRTLNLLISCHTEYVCKTKYVQ